MFPLFLADIFKGPCTKFKDVVHWHSYGMNYVFRSAKVSGFTQKHRAAKRLPT